MFDIVFATGVLLIMGPVILVFAALVWLEDRGPPFYLAPRVGRGGRDFRMIKVRSMILDADRRGANSTGGDDWRITRVGRFIRGFKIDELAQFLNVLKGDMSVVGPRPNTRAWGVDLYTAEEMRLLSVRPGVTDLASIVFADEGAILSGADNADELYNQIIRPWKSRLGLLYIENQSRWLDLRIVLLTALAVVNRPVALLGVSRILFQLGADAGLREVCRRRGPLEFALPPGAAEAG